MTEKQKEILSIAMELFAKEGFDAVSTSRIAKSANVSEGLIFKHFKSKQGLLDAILQLGQEAVEGLLTSLKEEDSPKEIIRQVIQMPFDMDEEQYHFWRLLYSLKWQADVYDESISEPIKEFLTQAFRKLNYGHPKLEAETLLILMDGIATTVLLKKPKNQNRLMKHVLNKYNL